MHSLAGSCSRVLAEQAIYTEGSFGINSWTVPSASSFGGEEEREEQAEEYGPSC